MRFSRTLGGSAAVVVGVGALVVVGVLGLTRSTQSHETTAATAASPVDRIIASTGTATWPERELQGSKVLTGQVPLTVASGKAKLVGKHPAKADAEAQLRAARSATRRCSTR